MLGDEKNMQMMIFCQEGNDTEFRELGAKAPKEWAYDGESSASFAPRDGFIMPVLQAIQALYGDESPELIVLLYP